MWRVSISIVGFVVTTIFSDLSQCLEFIPEQIHEYGITMVLWYRVEEKYNGIWQQRGFTKVN